MGSGRGAFGGGAFGGGAAVGGPAATGVDRSRRFGRRRAERTGCSDSLGDAGVARGGAAAGPTGATPAGAGGGGGEGVLLDGGGGTASAGGGMAAGAGGGVPAAEGFGDVDESSNAALGWKARRTSDGRIGPDPCPAAGAGPVVVGAEPDGVGKGLVGAGAWLVGGGAGSAGAGSAGAGSAGAGSAGAVSAGVGVWPARGDAASGATDSVSAGSGLPLSSNSRKKSSGLSACSARCSACALFHADSTKTGSSESPSAIGTTTPQTGHRSTVLGRMLWQLRQDPMCALPCSDHRLI